QGVLKKHPFCGAFLVFWGFKFLSMNLIDIINKWLSHGNIDPELAHFIIYLLDYLTTTHKSI
ncbi:hypothetical protein POW80_25905, partial [Escherichia coli]